MHGNSVVSGTNPAGPASVLTPARIASAMTCFLYLGLAGRAIRYALKFPLWEDECFLCVNFIDRSFAELLLPLTYHQVAPPLFLWLERAAVLLLGYSEWSLRLLPFVASIAALFLFRYLARQLLSPLGQLVGFGMFAIAYPGIRYAAEAKQYSTDLFAALLMMSLCVAWFRTRQIGWLIGLAVLVAPLLWLSYPAAFVAGGASLAIGWTLVAQGLGKVPVRDGLAWLGMNFGILIGFGTLMGVIRRQSAAELGFMTDYWQNTFPPLAEPLKLLVWFIQAHTSEMMAWPVGGATGASTFTGILFAIGVWQLVRSRNLFWCFLLLGPLVLNLVAAGLERYPYGGHQKFSMYAGPMICLLAGWGAASWNGRTAVSWPGLARRAAVATIGCLIFLGMATIARDVARPYKTRSDERARAFAQWFWFNAEGDGEVRVVDGFGGEAFSPGADSELTWTAMFLCNRAIYVPAQAPAIPAHLESPKSAERLRCVVYRDPRFEFSEVARDAWLEKMDETHRLVARESYPFIRYEKNERDFAWVDYLDVYTFQEAPAARIAAHAGAR